MKDQNEKIIDILHDVVGDNLRLVLRNRRQSWDTLYVRDGRGRIDHTDNNHTESEISIDEDRLDAIVHDLVFEELAWPAQADRYELGEPRATVRFFEDGIAVIISTGDANGYLVLLDTDHDVPLHDIVDSCRRTFC